MFAIHLVYPPQLTSTRIVGGEDAPEGSAPYQCSMQSGRSHFCGCSVLSNEWILTASHCVAGQSPSNVEILVGTNSLREGGQYYNIEKFIMHEKYNQPQFANDIALIKLKEPIEFNDRVKPIELGKDEVEDGAELKLTGWGRIRVSVYSQFLCVDFIEINVHSFHRLEVQFHNFCNKSN